MIAIQQNNIQEYFESVEDIIRNYEQAEFSNNQSSNQILLSQRNIVNDHKLIEFLLEVVSESKQFENELMRLVFQSRHSSEKNNHIISAANAITILVAGNVTFAGFNLSKINIIGANLRDGCFNECDFTDADLTGVTMENCKLINTIFKRTIMKDIKLGIFPDIDVKSPITSVMFSPNNNNEEILSGSQDKLVKLWNKTTGNLLKTFEGHTEKVNCVVFSSDGKLILSASDDHLIKLWDKNSGLFFHDFEGYEEGVNSVVFSPDGSLVLSASLYDKFSIRLWETKTGKMLKTLGEPYLRTNCIVFSPDGTLIASGEMGDQHNNSLKLWEPKMGNLIISFKCGVDVKAIAFSPEGTSVLSGHSEFEPRLVHWDLLGNILNVFEGNTASALSLAFSTDGKFIVCGSSDNSIKLWDKIT